jgi:hypothetical protein
MGKGNIGHCYFGKNEERTLNWGRMKRREHGEKRRKKKEEENLN